MKRITGICKYMLTFLFFLMVQFHYVSAQVGEEPMEGHPLNPSPYKVVFYMIFSFLVVAVAVKLLYRPKKKHNP
jgi:hypothetical protein